MKFTSEYTEFINQIGDQSADTDKARAAAAKYEANIIQKTEDRLEKGFRIFCSVLVVLLFLALNGLVAYLVLNAFNADLVSISKGSYKPSERLITPQVIMTLMGATFAEVAVAFGVLARYYFGSRSKLSDGHAQ